MIDDSFVEIAVFRGTGPSFQVYLKGFRVKTAFRNIRPYKMHVISYEEKIDIFIYLH